jgi:hypothetical protein
LTIYNSITYNIYQVGIKVKRKKIVTSGKLFLIEKEIREKFKKAGHSNFSYVAIAYLLDSFLSSLHYIYSISYILINRETKFFKNLKKDTIRGIKIKHYGGLQHNYVWFIDENNPKIVTNVIEKEK